MEEVLDFAYLFSLPSSLRENGRDGQFLLRSGVRLARVSVIKDPRK